MATCIRCGKPCNDDESMCDECKAWFQKKTGGAVPVRKAENEKKIEKAAQKSPNIVKEKRNLNINPKLFGIGAAAVAVIVVLIVAISFVSGNAKKRDKEVEAENDRSYEVTDESKDTYTENSQEYDDYADTEAFIEETSAEEPYIDTENMDDEVDVLKDVYAQQINSYLSSDSLQSATIDGNTCYYLNDKLVEIDVENVQGSTGYTREYYFDNGALYYANIYKVSGVSNELYFDHDILIRWIDADGTNHDAEYNSAAFNEWYVYQTEAYDLFYTYKEPSSLGIGVSGEFVFPNSNRTYLSEADLVGLSEWELRVGRNEIMARHGRQFKDVELQNHFNSCSWYQGTMSPEVFDSQYEAILNEYEKKNADLIKEYENR